jgi:SAM-dependent methyltransferase
MATERMSRPSPPRPKTFRTLLPVPAELEWVNCPGCRAAQHDVLLRADSFGFPVGLVECRACGLVFSNPRPTERYMNRFYRARYRAFYEGQGEITEAYIARRGWREGAATRVRRYAGFVPSGGRVLDIGCGAGLFLSVLREARPDVTVQGIEPNHMQAAYARDALGVPVHEDLFNTFDAAAPFDLVVAFHVAEHIHDLPGFFGFLHRVAAPGATVALETPNLESGWRGIGMFHIAHLYAFTPDSLARLASRHGFAAIRAAAAEEGWDAHNLQVVLRLAASPAPHPPSRIDEGVRRRCRGAARPRWQSVVRSWAKLLVRRAARAASARPWPAGSRRAREHS